MESIKSKIRGIKFYGEENLRSKFSSLIYYPKHLYTNVGRPFAMNPANGLAYKLQPVFRGFTMLEMTLSLAILGIIFGMTMPLYRVFMVRNDLDIAVGTLVQDFRRAQTLSSITDGDSSWGVHVATGSILIYKGASYASRDQGFDEDTTISSSISVSGLSDVIFSKQTGMPQSTGTTTFTSVTNEIRNVTINQKGMVDY